MFFYTFFLLIYSCINSIAKRERVQVHITSEPLTINQDYQNVLNNSNKTWPKLMKFNYLIYFWFVVQVVVVVVNFFVVVVVFFLYTEKKVHFGCRNNANIEVCTPSKKACKCVSDWRANLKKIGVCKPHFSLSGQWKIKTMNSDEQNFLWSNFEWKKQIFLKNFIYAK